MRRLLLLIAMILLYAVGIAQDKTINIKYGDTYVDANFTAADTINESDSYWVLINCNQDFPQMQDLYVTLDSVSGDPNVTVTLQGKKFSGDSFVTIGTPIIWEGTAEDTTIIYTNATANRYRYYKVLFATTATDQQVKLTDLQFKTWFTGGTLSVTSITDGTATFTDGALTGATTGAFSGNVTVGGTLGITGVSTTAAITASGLITANNGITLGPGDDLIGSSTSDITINTNKFTVAGATGDVVIGNDLDVVADLTSGTITSGLAQVSTINFADATAVAGTADAITINFATELTITTGTIIYFIAEAANTGVATLAVDGGAATAIVESSDGSALEAGDIPNLGCVELMFDGTSWQQLSQSGN
jgi:hypothetical protein